MDLHSLYHNDEPHEDDVLDLLEGPGSPAYMRGTAALLRMLVVARLTVVTAAAGSAVSMLASGPALHLGLALLAGSMMLAGGVLLRMLHGRLDGPAREPLQRAGLCLLGAGAATGLLSALSLAAVLLGAHPGELASGPVALGLVPWALAQLALANACERIEAAYDPTADRGLRDVVRWAYVAALIWSIAVLILVVSGGLPGWAAFVLSPLPLWLGHLLGTVQVWQAGTCLENGARNAAAPPPAPENDPDDQAPRPPHWPADIGPPANGPPF
jgi:hypothetical protein